MAIILFGGSFDPIHNGHLAMAKAALDFLPQATLMFMPAACSPFKVGKTQTAEHHRFAMCSLAANDPRMQVSDLEFLLPKPSYTVRTVEHLQKETPDDYYFLCGADSFLTLERWKDYNSLLRKVTFLVTVREGSTKEELTAKQQWVKEQGGKVHLLAMPRVDVSSTNVRAATDPTAYVPLSVARYIQENGLYRE